MHETYAELPFGVAVLDFPSLKIEYFNNRFKSELNVEDGILGRELLSIKGFDELKKSILQCGQGENCIRKVKVVKDTYYDIITQKLDGNIVIFLHKLQCNNSEKEEMSLEKLDSVALNMLKSMIDCLPYFVYITDANGQLIHMNSVAENTFKADNINISDKNIFNILRQYEYFLVDDSLLNEADLPLSKVLKGEGKIEKQVIKYKRNNLFSYISTYTFPIIIDNKVLGAIVASVDVTVEYLKNLKITEEREKFLSMSTELKTKCDIIEILRNREKEHLMHLKDVINNISEGLIVLDNKGNFNFCNRAVYTILDVNASDLAHFPNIDSKYEISCSGYHIHNLRTLFDESRKQCKHIKNLVLFIKHRATGEVKYLEFSSNPIVNKKMELLYIIVTLKDVTEVKRHEILAEEQANFIKDVVDTMDVPIAVVDYPEMKIKLANKNFDYMAESFSGEKINSMDLIDKNIEELFKKKSGLDLYRALYYCGAIDKEYTFSPYELNDSNDSKRFYKIKFKPFKDKFGKNNRIYIHALDITEEINHSLELEKITNLKDEFFTVISHELRTPLTIIYSSLQLAYDIYGKEIGPNIDKTLGRINQNCSRLLKLINNILDISKAEAGFLTLNTIPFDFVYVTEFVVNSVNFYARSKGIDLIFDTNMEEVEVCLDKDKYEKILLNLLSNAVKFTPEGKQILITIEADETYITLSVKDEGVGIPEDKLESIFDRFAQVNSSLSRRAEGTGLGLSLVKKLVEMMDGTISVSSVVEEGSEFILKFKNICTCTDKTENYSMFDTSMNDKINIEFSDVN